MRPKMITRVTKTEFKTDDGVRFMIFRLNWMKFPRLRNFRKFMMNGFQIISTERIDRQMDKKILLMSDAVSLLGVFDETLRICN